jgi:hypothetical protein
MELTEYDFITMMLIQEKLLKCAIPDEIDAIENLYAFLLTERSRIVMNKRPSMKKTLLEKAHKYRHFEACQEFIKKMY